ncbi:Ribonuclease 3 1 [Planktothrix tepida]|uniref:Ribonuclease 3 n=2 Tax=Planktothrix TaxID=54304 RepID=A0A1J1LGS5_9CYAN|nr:Ribonuclease 3 1 [Planktothrix tepida]CUR31781.1 Ribonuclease 3 1 [Planktothrix tepida PCC 9214]
MLIPTVFSVGFGNQTPTILNHKSYTDSYIMMTKLPEIKNEQLRLQALTHRSYINEHPNAGEDNERLEFLGDAVLGFLVGELLFKKRYPEDMTKMSEANMTRLRSALVDEKQLAKFAIQFNLGELLRLGKGAIRDGGRTNPALLSDAFEAYIGAYYLDTNIDAVRDFIHPLFSAVANEIVFPQAETTPQTLIDCKNRFQQWALAEYGENPKYYVVGESGPDHAKEFQTEVRVRDKVYGYGKGRRKQDAEKRAAEVALQKLGLL